MNKEDYTFRMAKNIFDPKTKNGIINICIIVGIGISFIVGIMCIWVNNINEGTFIQLRVGEGPLKKFLQSLQKYKIFNAVMFFFITALLIAVLITYSLTNTYNPDVKEQFFFEVSPERDQCLKEQVSRNNYGERRGCACCGKGTVGGIPPNYAEWLTTDNDTGSTWHRPDAVQQLPLEDESKPPCNNTTQTFSNAEEATCSSCTQPTYITYI